jgi:hypothetical protein
MKVNWSTLLSALKKAGLFMPALKLAVTNPLLVPDAIKAEETGIWLPFVKQYWAVLHPYLDTIVQALDSNPALEQEILSALVDATAAAAGAQ